MAATLGKIISMVDDIKPNAFSDETKTAWLNECEGMVQTQVFLLSQDSVVTYEYYKDRDRELLAKPPFDKIYWAYLSAMIDFANGEYNKYQNAMQMFNAWRSEYMRWFAATYHPADGEAIATGYYVIGAKGDQGLQGIQGVAGQDGLTTSVNGVAHVNGAITLTQDNIPDGSTNKAFTATEKTKLAGVATGANNYTHPATHPASMITDLPTGKKVARFVVGTSTAGWTAADCDYLCDGTADQVEINAAITALPATGGEVVILDGTYNITAKIDVAKDNVSIRGNGNATILKRMFDSSVAEGVITLTGRSGCKIADLQVDGNKGSYTDNDYNYGIQLNNSSNNTITSNTCINNFVCICLSYSRNNAITGNICNSNNLSIYMRASNNNTVTCNTCNNNDSGISLDASSKNTVTGNTCNNNDYGISLDASSNNTVTGNTCIRGTGTTGDYTAVQHTINLNGTGNSYNLIAMNNCMGKAVTNDGGTGDTLVNNKFDAT